MAKRNIVNLFASQDILWHDNGDGEESVLISLLEEADKSGLKDNQLIRVSYERAGKFSGGLHPQIISKATFMKYDRLKELYRKWNDGEDYSSEREQEKKEFEMNIYDSDARKKAAWGNYLSTMNRLRVVKSDAERAEVLKKTEGCKEREELKKKWEKEDFPSRGHLVIL